MAQSQARNYQLKFVALFVAACTAYLLGAFFQFDFERSWHKSFELLTHALKQHPSDPTDISIDMNDLNISKLIKLIRNNDWKYHNQSKQKLTINLNFIHGSFKRASHGPFYNSESTKNALISYAADKNKLCQLRPALNVQLHEPSYVTIQRDDIINFHDVLDIHLNVEVNNFDDLSKFDMIYMTAIIKGEKSHDMVFNEYVKHWQRGHTDIIMVVGPNIKNSDIAKLRIDKNQYMIHNNKITLDERSNKTTVYGESTHSFRGYIPNPMSQNLVDNAKYYSMINDGKNRRKCITYLKKSSPIHSYAMQLDKEYNYSCQVIKYGQYKREDLLSLAKQSEFAIIADVSETQGFAFMELLSFNVPLFIIDYHYDAYFSHQNVSRVFRYFDNTKSGHICPVKVDDMNSSQIEAEIKQCFDKFIINIHNNIYNPSLFALSEFNPCQFVQTFLDMFLPKIVESKQKKYK